MLALIYRQAKILWELPEVTTVANRGCQALKMHRLAWPFRDRRPSGCSHRYRVLALIYRRAKMLWERPQVTTVANAAGETLRMPRLTRPLRDRRSSGCSHRDRVLALIYRRAKILWELPQVTTVANRGCQALKMPRLTRPPVCSHSGYVELTSRIGLPRTGASPAT